MFKKMSDAALDDSIVALRSLAYNASMMKSMRLGKLLRDLDIAVAVKRSRMRNGTWTGAAGNGGRHDVAVTK